MADSKPLVLYDISSPKQPRPYAPNPSKSRLALGFKGVPFETTWIDILDIPDVRKELNCAATRKLDDGSDYYTLPMLLDPASGKVIGDSFDIANYLEDMFPDSGESLFPANSTLTGLDYESPAKDTPFYAPITTNEGSKNSAYARFNLHVDTTFSANVVALYSQYLPFNPATAEATKTMFAKRAHLNSWDDLLIQGEARKPLKAAFNSALKSLADLMMINETGPYLEGKQVTYADLIIGGWLNMMFSIMPKEEWEDFRKWYGGVFARLHDALQEQYFVCK